MGRTEGSSGLSLATSRPAINLEMFEGAEAASHALGPVEQPVDGFGHAEVLSGGTEPRGLVGFHCGGQLSSRPSAQVPAREGAAKRT